MGEADQLGARSHQRVQVGKFQLQRIRADGPGLDDGALLLFQLQPGADIGFVVGVGDDDLVTGGDFLGQGGGQRIHQRRGGRPHDDFIRPGGADQFRDVDVGVTHPRAGLLRDGVAGAELDVAGEQIVGNAVGDRAQGLRSTGIVEEDPVAGQRWELSPDEIEVEGRQHAGKLL